jgi:hypothetical protein
VQWEVASALIVSNSAYAYASLGLHATKYIVTRNRGTHPGKSPLAVKGV